MRRQISGIESISEKNEFTDVLLLNFLLMTHLLTVSETCLQHVSMIFSFLKNDGARNGRHCECTIIVEGYTEFGYRGL